MFVVTVFERSGVFRVKIDIAVSAISLHCSGEVALLCRYVTQVFDPSIFSRE